MEPTVELYVPSRLYARIGWAALVGSAVCVLFGLRAPFAYAIAFLCGLTAVALFWLASRPMIRIGETQFNIGDRAIAWREVREINGTKLFSPLILRVKLTNSRHKLLIFPGEPDRIQKLIHQLRKKSYMATFDGVAHKDYWTWSSMNGLRGDNAAVEQPVRMLSTDEEEEIERMYQRLKAVGRLDGRSDLDGSNDHLS